MPLTTKDPALADHLAWLGYVQPDGLVVSAPALVDAQAIIDRAQLGELQRRFSEHVTSLRLAESDAGEAEPGIENIQQFVTEFLGWPANLLVGVDPSCPLPASLSVALPEFQETLHPSWAVKNPKAEGDDSPWLLLVKTHPATVDLDKPAASSERGWHASPSKKFERLLRETGVPIGLVTNGTHLRLIYAPPKENSGTLTFPVAAMTEVSGRLILGAFQLLLGAWTLFNAPTEARLPALLQRSRDYQASVSEILAEQVLHALYELLRGFETADERAQTKLLPSLAAGKAQEIYGGLVTVLLRLVFTLFAEDRGLLPASGLYVRNYSVHGLFERLRANAERYPDTMDHRFGAWAQLLALFRVIHGGCRHPDLKMPARAGHLFDPDRYPFLEGRTVVSGQRSAASSQRTEASGGQPVDPLPLTAHRAPPPHRSLPLISDGTIHRILEKLCILEGERVSYRTLDVEEIGSVYQTIMGFAVETAEGTAIALKGKRKHGGVPAAPVITLEPLLAVPAKDRAKWLKENADTELTGEADSRLKTASTVDDLLVALGKKMDVNATPAPVPKGGLVLQPTDERRRSGSHYTPRSFTEPIVRKTLEPILRRLAEQAAGNGQGGRGKGEKEAANGSDQQLSGSQGVASGSAAGPANLSGDSELPSGGAVRADLANAASGRVDSLEHRGGMVPPASRGIPPVPACSPGQLGGTGNASASQSGPGPDAGDHILGTVEPLRRSEPATPRSGTSASAPASPVPLPSSLLSLKIADIAVGSAAFLVEACRQLADELVEAWRVHGGRPALPPDETEELLAMRLIAQRCLYGVDRNPMAVDLAKLSLWLATLAKDHPFTFLDHAIRCGDSLVGLTRRQIETFTWKTESKQGQLWEAEVRRRTAGALRERQNLLGMGDDYGTPQLKRERLERADELLDTVRFIGDAGIAAFFSADKDKAREAKRVEFAERISDYLGKGDPRLRPTAEVRALRGEVVNSEQRTVNSDASPAVHRSPLTVDPGEARPTAEHSLLTAHRIIPFHWQIEFPEVFDRENPGFDGIVGNPPFAGKNTLSNSTRRGFPDWLKVLNDESHGNADLVAHFFRRAFDLLRDDGCFGLIATKTISQGDTRATGLRWICTRGGTIYSAHKRYKWPGQAAVTVSVVNVIKGPPTSAQEIDGRPVPAITAYLFHMGGHETPSVLARNHRKSFAGPIVLGMGFTFDDTDTKGIASPISEMQRLIAKDNRNAERIFPYVGGEEINESPTHSHHRYVIGFGEMSEEEARQWPDLIAIVERRVKPERDKLGGNTDAERRKRFWWHWGRYTPALDNAVRGFSRVLVTNAQASTYHTLVFNAPHVVFANSLNVFPFESLAVFAVLQSGAHEIWARFFSSSLEDRLRYNPTDCFETFPFPAGFETNEALEAAGREYYEFRAALMQDLWLGLTDIYNLFHSPDDEALARLEALYRKRAASSEWRAVEKVPPDRSPFTIYGSPAAALEAIHRLRELHAAMDTAVLTAYGWTDLLPRCTCQFLLDYEDEEETSGEQSAVSGGAELPLAARRSPLASRARKKPWRYRWPDELRDEVLARLLKLNAERAEEERVAGLAAATAKQPKPAKKGAGATAPGVKTQLALGLATATATERKLPTDFRLPVTQPLLYTTNLVVALLSEAGGSLAWLRLLDAFQLATNPKLMQRFAPEGLAEQAKAWSARWNEKVPDGLLVPSLRQLGGKNLTVTEGAAGRVFHLLDGRRPPATEDVRYDAWLALRVAEALTPDAVQIPDRAKWAKEANELVFT